MVFCVLNIFYFLFFFVEMNLGGKVQLVIANDIGNILSNPFDIPAQNQKVNEYIATIFDFVKKFLAFDGVVLLFCQDDLRVLKEVKSCVENYGLKIQIKWVVVNSLPLMSNKDPSLKVPSQTFKLSLYFSFSLLQLKFV